MSVLHPLIYDWNNEQGTVRTPVMLDDETLRDGLQSPSVRMPSIDDKIDILHRMDALGIDTADIGLPGAGAARRRRRRTARADDRQTSGWRSRPTAPRAPSSPTFSRSPRSRSAPACRSSAAPSSAQPDPAVRRGLDARLPAAQHRRRHRVRRRARACTVMYVTEDTTRADPDIAAGAVLAARIRAGAVAHLRRRHGRPCHAGRRGSRGALRGSG